MLSLTERLPAPHEIDRLLADALTVNLVFMLAGLLACHLYRRRNFKASYAAGVGIALFVSLLGLYMLMDGAALMIPVVKLVLMFVNAAILAFAFPLPLLLLFLFAKRR